MEPQTTLLERARETAAGSDRRENGIALCLSGGGYRAALFHLGAFRRLHELGLLARIAAVSSVSGGSILNAFLIDRLVASGRSLGDGFSDWQREVADPFRRFCSRDIRTCPFLLHLPWNWLWTTPRVKHLQRSYRRYLTKLSLAQIPEGPRFVLCATDLVFGASWEFGRARTGDWQAGYVRDAGKWPLALAVAASSCFPPIFGPLGLSVPAQGWTGGDYRKRDRDRMRRRMALSDGGVYDNMGLEPVWKDYTTILVSDGGAPFEFEVGGNPIRRLLRYTSVVTSQSRALRVRILFSDRREGRYSPAYWSLTGGSTGTDPGEPYLGYSEELAEEVIGRIRTDLDSFSEAEKSVLENHGYFAVERSIRRSLPDLISPQAPPPLAPYPEYVDETRVRRELRHSHRRFRVGRLVKGLWGNMT